MKLTTHLLLRVVARLRMCRAYLYYIFITMAGLLVIVSGYYCLILENVGHYLGKLMVSLSLTELCFIKLKKFGLMCHHIYASLNLPATS